MSQDFNTEIRHFDHHEGVWTLGIQYQESFFPQEIEFQVVAICREYGLEFTSSPMETRPDWNEITVFCKDHDIALVIKRGIDSFVAALERGGSGIPKPMRIIKSVVDFFDSLKEQKDPNEYIFEEPREWEYIVAGDESKRKGPVEAAIARLESVSDSGQDSVFLEGKTARLVSGIARETGMTPNEIVGRALLAYTLFDEVEEQNAMLLIRYPNEKIEKITFSL